MINTITSEHQQQFAITGHGSLVLDRPLTFSHAMGVRIVSAGADANDNDADGLTTPLHAGHLAGLKIGDRDFNGGTDGPCLRTRRPRCGEGPGDKARPDGADNAGTPT